MNSGGWYDGSGIASYGTVTTNQKQDIYVDDTMPITQVYVQAGDTVKVGRGGEEDGIHTLQEWYEPKEAWLGPQRDLLLMILLAGAEGICEPAIEKR